MYTCSTFFIAFFSSRIFFHYHKCIPNVQIHVPTIVAIAAIGHLIFFSKYKIWSRKIESFVATSICNAWCVRKKNWNNHEGPSARHERLGWFWDFTVWSRIQEHRPSPLRAKVQRVQIFAEKCSKIFNKNSCQGTLWHNFAIKRFWKALLAQLKILHFYLTL